MKKVVYSIVAAVAMLLPLGSCSDDEPTVSGGGTVVGAGDDMPVFDIEFDATPLEESDEITKDPNKESYDEYFENKAFPNKVVIIYSEGKAEVTGQVPGVAVEVKGAGVVVNSTVAGVEYELKGSSSNSYFRLYGDNYTKVILAGVKLNNPTGAAINIQSKAPTYLHLVEKSVNSLSDGKTYEPVAPMEDMKGCIFAEGKLIFSGKGVLDISANCKNAISSDMNILFRPGNVINITSTASNGIKAKTGVRISGGVLNIDVKGEAAKGINSESYVVVSGGRTIIKTSGNSKFNGIDLTNAAGVKCDTDFGLSGGKIAVKTTGKGGKGINVNGAVTISSGELDVLVTGSKYIHSPVMSSTPKGINSDLVMMINGGKVKARVNDSSSGEGLESKVAVLINGGRIEVSTVDDCIKGEKYVDMSNALIYAYSADGDAIDSNGEVNILNSLVVAVGGKSNNGIECMEGKFKIDVSDVVAIGGSNTTMSSDENYIVSYTSPVVGGECLLIVDEKGNDIMGYKLPKSYDSVSLLMTARNMKKQNSYKVKKVTSLEGNNFHGMYF